MFSRRQVVEDLPIGFVAEHWVRAVDLGTLGKCNGGYVSDDLRDREEDIVWRVRRGDEMAYVYLLLEFQRSADAWLALRMMVCVGLVSRANCRPRCLLQASPPWPGLLP